MMPTSRRTMLLRMLLGAVALAGLTFWAWDAHDRNLILLHGAQLSADPFKMDADRAIVREVRPEAEQAGLMKGDTVDTLNGEPYTGQAQWARVNAAKPGGLLTVGFHRGSGATKTARIVLQHVRSQPGAPTSVAEWWQQFALFGFMPLLCMLIGYWVVFARPAEPNAWLLLILLIFPEVVFGFATGLATGGWLLFRGLYYQVLQIVGPLVLLPFAIYFPERSRIDVRLPWLKWAVLVPAAVCGVIDLRQLLGQFYFGGNPGWMVALSHQSDRLENALNLLCVVLYLVILTDKLRSASTQDARRRLRVLLAGTGTGLFALLVAFVLLPDLGFSPVKSGLHWVPYVGTALFLLAPLTLAYAGLRASLRGVTIDDPGDFAKMMEKINRLVYEASASNRYATFFFGALDPATRVLECVNAGHNAPLVLRRQPGGETTTVRIEADGPVVGLLPSASYSEQKIQLQPGDLLLLYTDGISEAMTHDDEEWGEERMMAAAGLHGDASAQQVLETIFAEADRFTAGAPQHDDMTVLVLRLDPA